MSCENPDTCKFCNPEPLTLEGDIRYLKAHIETKDRQLADAEKRIDIYREAWADAEKAAIRLDEKNSQLLTRITELEDAIMRLGEEKRIGGLGYNLGLQQEIERLKRAVEISVDGHTQTDKKYVELAHENKKLREENERLKRTIELSAKSDTLANTRLIELAKQNETLKTENDKLYHINCGINHRVSVLEQQVITLEGHKARYQQEILDLRKEKETLVNDRTSLVEEANELYEAIGRISGIVNEIID